MSTIDLSSIGPGFRASARNRQQTDDVTTATTATPGAVRATSDRPSIAQRITSLLGTLLMVLAIAAVLFFAIGPRFLGYQTATMLTGSMAPEIMPGDVVVTTVQPVSDIAVGDVISYHIPVEDHRVETHRVIEVMRGTDGSTAVRTKGDANQAADPWIATLEGDYVYEATATIPEVGNVIRALRTPVVRQALVYGVPAVLVGSLLLMIWSRPKEEDDDASVGTPATVEDRPGSPVMPTAGGTDVPLLPVLDRSVLQNLGVELSSHAGALHFAETFVQLLPQRIAAVESAFRAEDTDAAVVALLSLNVSASMVGASRLEESTSAALRLIENPSAHPGLIARLRSLGDEFQSALGGIMR
ncbi:signal peptidase I [Arthrobacter sp. B1805]|uniref:signal peptidase I n=1 Tax=Arthrobacter sp. B1805 TaxID=2058892 RepID=UPI0021589E67|nr:signal peptidase I [Arthrobacter sp. B1805]